MTRLNVNDARCEALFASGLQRSDAPTPETLAEVISRTVRQFGIAGCLSRMAQEFGDHPEAAASRMRWIRQLVSGTYAPAASRPARLGGWPPTPAPARSAARSSDWPRPPRRLTRQVRVRGGPARVPRQPVSGQADIPYPRGHRPCAGLTTARHRLARRGTARAG